MKIKYYHSLDGLRGIAALMVVVFHFFSLKITANYSYEWLPLAQKLAEFGQTGVSLFFVLSGFVITRILFQTKDKPGYFKNFYARRSLRIFPLYYLYLIIFFFLFPLIFGTHKFSFSEQLYSYFYLQNIASTFNWNAPSPGHFWSLAVEEHFYLFWPLVIYYFSIKRLPVVVGVIFIISFITKLILLNKGLNIGKFTLTRIDQISLGALIAYFELQRPAHSNVKMSIYAAIIGLILIIMTLFFKSTFYYIAELLKYPALGLFYGGIISLLVFNTNNTLFSRFLTSNWMVYSGKISYGLYVYHPFVILLVAQFYITGNIFLDFVLVIISTYLLASISYYMFESKFLKLKTKFE